MKKLTAKDVTFEVTIEPEEISVRGNASAWGEPEDTEYADEIIRRLEAGDDAAWCCIVVKATWTAPDGQTFEGYARLGACSIGERMMSGTEVAREVDVMVVDYGLRGEALASLDATLDNALKRAHSLATMLQD